MKKEVLKKCEELAELLKQDERMTALADAKRAYEESAEIKRLMMEYNVQQIALTEEYKKDTRDEEFIKIINNRIEELYNAISNNPVMKNYISAQEEVNLFMQEVNSEINFFITGDRPCSHDCSSCSSNCSGK